MMVGSIFYNCWAALVTFTIYFVVTLLQHTYLPSQILLGAFIIALVTFVAMFIIRLFIGYVVYTPKEELFDEINKVNNDLIQQTKDTTNQHTMNDKSSTIEFNDESSEEIAKVVRTMMNSEDN